MSKPGFIQRRHLDRIRRSLRVQQYVPSSEVKSKKSRLRRTAAYAFAIGVLLFLVALLFNLQTLAYVSALPMALVSFYLNMASCVLPEDELKSEEAEQRHLRSVQARRVWKRHEP